MTPPPRHGARGWRGALVATALLVSSGLPCGPASATGVMPAAAVVPHTAGYSMQVLPVGNGGGILGGRGVLQLEWRRDCEGMAYSQHSVLTLNNEDGAVFDSSVRIDSWEAADASRFRFLLESSIDGEVTEEVSGLAERSKDGAVAVRYRKPEERSETMPRETVFPWQQMRAVLAGIRGGKRHQWYRLLRGEGEGDPIGVSVHIAGREGPPKGLGDQGDLLPGEGWRVISAFFENRVTPEPDFEIAETVLASGVITRAEITYPDMIMRLKLERLKRGATPSCGG
ncbi:MAG: DUF1849 family protein [Alphaproteobacteria bacterium]|nr:DUF1849 family protein [Alphaproteobacteria bacterium]MCB9931092.1 DUF1849 family protein [Alphaproteobacteria bacterium]